MNHDEKADRFRIGHTLDTADALDYDGVTRRQAGQAGGKWVDHEVVRDGIWVGRRKPDDPPPFNEARVELRAEAPERAAA